MANTPNLGLPQNSNWTTGEVEAWAKSINDESDINNAFKKIDNFAGEVRAALLGKQPKHSAQTITLTVADWSNNQQTISVTGVTASNTVIVSPTPASVSDYGTAGIYCSAQASGALTFTCTAVPTAAVTVNVAIFG